MKFMKYIAIGIVSILIGCNILGDETGLSGNLQDNNLSDVEIALQLNVEALERIETGDHENAVRLLKQALESDINCGAVHNNLGGLYFNQSKLYLAAWEFQHAIKLLPNNSAPVNNLGLVYEEVNQLEKAIEWFKKALDLDKDSIEIKCNLARARIRRGDKDEELKKVLEEIAINDLRYEWTRWAEEQSALMHEFDN